MNLCFSYMAQRDFEAADKTVDRLIATTPQSFQARVLKGFVALQCKGDLNTAEKVFSSMPPETDPGLMTLARVWILRLKRNFPEALQVLQQFRGDTLHNTTTAPSPKAFLEGELYRLQGDEAKARTAFEQARTVAERLVREGPDDAPRRVMLGQVLAALGQKDAAIAEGKRAAELLPESEDAFGGHDQAFRLLDHLLETPNGLTVPLLKLDPAWDPLRKDPRYQALLDKYSRTAT